MKINSNICLQAHIEVQAYKTRTAKGQEQYAMLQQMLVEDLTIDPYTNEQFSKFVFQIDIDYMMVSTMFVPFNK